MSTCSRIPPACRRGGRCTATTAAARGGGASRDVALERAQRLPIASRPGTAWCYSDLGPILAGRIVEQVTTLGLADAFRTLVAEPLGLAARYGPIPAARAAASADSDAYEFGMVASGRPYPVPFTAGQFPGWRNRPLRGEVNDGNAAHALGGVAGHAGLFATVGDLLRLGAAVRGGDFIPAPVLARFADPRRRPSRAGGRLPPAPAPGSATPT